MTNSEIGICTLHVIKVYAPVDGKQLEEQEFFCEQLQEELNARVGKDTVV